MSESEPTGETAPDDQVNGETLELPPRVDVRHLAPSSELQMVISLVLRNKENKIPLTLTTTSGVIVGVAVHPSVWHRAMAEHVRTLGENAAPLATSFDLLAEESAVRYDELDVNEHMERISFVYLVDAAIFPLGGSGVGDFALGSPRPWNVHLRHVGAWSLGIPGQHQE